MVRKTTKTEKVGKSETKRKHLAAKEIEFSLYAPEASEVFLAGEFNQWDTRSLPMGKDGEGIWRRMVELHPGSYEYKFLVDGAWFEGMTGSQLVRNSFGTQNYIVGV